MASEIAAKIEFLTLTEITLSDGKIVPISQLQAAYKEILNVNNVANETMNRKALKQLLQNYSSPQRNSKLHVVIWSTPFFELESSTLWWLHYVQ